MYKKFISALTFSIISVIAYTQNVGINTTGNNADPSSMLDVNADNKGILIPRVSLVDVSNGSSPVNSPAIGLLVYNTNGAVTGGYGQGFYYWNGTVWVKMVAAPGDNVYINNQNATDQAANFRISGVGRMNTSVQAPIYTRADAGTVGVRPNTNSTTAIQLQDASGYVVMNVDATNVRIGVNTDAPTVSLDVRASDAVKLPSGTTAQRPVTPLAGSTRFNSDNKALEYYDGTQWVSANMEQTPIGTIIPFGGSTIPTGWLLCDGSAISRTTYSELFAVIGTSWGSGNGSTTFHLPDLRGRFLRGVDGSAGRDPDAGSRTAANAGGNTANNVGSVQGDALASHTHGVTGNTAGSGVLNTNAESAHTHSIDPPNTQTDTQGGHNHGRGGTNDVGNGSYGLVQRSTGPNTVQHTDNSAGEPNVVAAPRELGLATDGAHQHNLNIPAFTSGAGSAHSHTINDHNHSINLTTGNPSSANTSENRPKNANVTYIIKATSNTSVAITSVNIGSGIFGQTLYNNGANWIATSNLYNNGTQVSIGNTAPQQALSVTGGVNIDQGNTNAGTVATALTFGSTSGEGIASKRSAGGNQFGLDFYTQSTNRMSITSGGNVGIGVTSPAQKLSVEGNAEIRTGAHLIMQNGDNSHDMRLRAINQRMDVLSSSDLGTPIATFNNGGNVGIGTTNAIARLTVAGGGILMNSAPYAFTNVPAYQTDASDQFMFYPTTLNTNINGLLVGTDLRLYIEDDYNDAFSIWGNSCGTGCNDLNNSLFNTRFFGDGRVQMRNLAGSGTKVVVADANGVLKGSAAENSVWTVSMDMASSPDDLGGGDLSFTGDDDDGYYFHNLPFTYYIEGVGYNRITICTNGWIAFGEVSSTNKNATSLPASFTNNPVIFPFWTDLKDFGSGEGIRVYNMGGGTNQVVVVHCRMKAYCGNTANPSPNHYAEYQVMIHQNGGINVKYINMNPPMNGQIINCNGTYNVTIGFQLSGGSSAKNFPISYNAKVLDDNRMPESWSVSPVK